MKTSKTPMQEFVEYFIRNSFRDETKLLILDSEELKGKLISWAEREKQFAESCFEAGFNYGYDQTTQNFEQFYSQYVIKHKE